MMIFIYVSVCLEAHTMPHRGVHPGIAACLARECLQASAGGNGLIQHNYVLIVTNASIIILTLKPQS